MILVVAEREDEARPLAEPYEADFHTAFEDKLRIAEVVLKGKHYLHDESCIYR